MTLDEIIDAIENLRVLPMFQETRELANQVVRSEFPAEDVEQWAEELARATIEADD
jgi:hypothetical protein